MGQSQESGARRILERRAVGTSARSASSTTSPNPNKWRLPSAGCRLPVLKGAVETFRRNGSIGLVAGLVPSACPQGCLGDVPAERLYEGWWLCPLAAALYLLPCRIIEAFLAEG